MAHQGQVIENPRTGERIVFLHTRRETDGEFVDFDHFLRPGPSAFGEHVQLNQEERFEIVSGVARYRLSGELGSIWEGPGIDRKARERLNRTSPNP